MTHHPPNEGLTSLCAIAASFGAGLASVGWAERVSDRRRVKELSVDIKERELDRLIKQEKSR